LHIAKEGLLISPTEGSYSAYSSPAMLCLPPAPE
jgi:hypothetical protein